MWSELAAELSHPTTTTVLLGGALALSLLWWLSTRRPSGIPPGPGPALPLLGHLHLMEKDPREKFKQWRRQYGDVFSLYMGGRLVVVLNGYQVIKEALVKLADVFSNRPHWFISDVLAENKGIICTSGPLWREQRKTAQDILKQLGLGKNVLAEKIQEEVTHYIRALEDHQGAPVDVSALTKVSVCNNTCSIVFGKRFEYDDKVLLQYMEYIEESFRLTSGSALVHYLPYLIHLPGDLFQVKRLVLISDKVKAFIQSRISPILAERTPKEERDRSDYVNLYTDIMEEKIASGEETTLTGENLNLGVGDMFVAGTETTATTIRWALLLFLHHPHVQDKCYKEISDVIGNRPPSMRDRPEMTYLEATIMEVQRFADVVPLNVPHGLASDVIFRGYVIPKDAMVFPSLNSVFSDPEVWGDPDNFRPERFIGPDGKLTRPEEFIPFGIGRRVCLGESLARMELFLYLSNLIQRFCFLPAEPESLPSLQGILGISYNPAPYKLRAISRN